MSKYAPLILQDTLTHLRRTAFGEKIGKSHRMCRLLIEMDIQTNILIQQIKYTYSFPCFKATSKDNLQPGRLYRY